MSDAEFVRLIPTAKSVGTKCWICFGPGPCNHHHLIPRELGGSDLPANLLRVCIECHKLIHERFTNQQLAEKYNTYESLKIALLKCKPRRREILVEIPGAGRKTLSNALRQAVELCGMYWSDEGIYAREGFLPKSEARQLLSFLQGEGALYRAPEKNMDSEIKTPSPIIHRSNKEQFRARCVDFVKRYGGELLIIELPTGDHCALGRELYERDPSAPRKLIEVIEG